jgi:predicted Zn-dependent protease
MCNKGLAMRNYYYFAILLLLSGCATMGDVTSFKSGADTGNLQEKERRLWHEAAGFDATIERSDQIYNDKKATAYLQSVMDRMYPEFKGKILVHIYDSTELNAFALPNGSIYFNIGLLSRMENEAQLAAVMAHEATHFIEKHSFQQRVSTKNSAAFAVSGIPFASLAAASSISGFSQDLEREADTMGYARLVKSGYDPREAHKIFQYLADEVQALNIEEPYFFSSHPQLVERIDEFKRLSANHKGGGRIGSKSYNRIVTPIRLETLRKDIGQDRYQSVILVMEDSKKRRYYPAAGYYYLGEAYLRRDENGDMNRALKAYQKAAKHSPNFAPTYKRLGMYYLKKGKKNKARYNFKLYLSLAPKNARDRTYVEQYMNTL